MAAPAGSEGYQAVPSADYELVPQEHAKASEGGAAPDAAHSDTAAVAAAADAAVREDIARLWLTADCLACALAVVAVALLIVAAHANAIAIFIAVVITAVPAATHACARWDGSNEALHATLFVHSAASFMGYWTICIICIPGEKWSLTKLNGWLAVPMAVAYFIVAGGVWFVSMMTKDNLKRVEGVHGAQPSTHVSTVAAARVQSDVEAARSEAAAYRQEREAAARRQLKLRLEAAELRALEAFEAAKAQAPDGKLSCPWKAPGAHWPDSSWERWRAAADRLQLFNTDPDAYIQQHGYYGCY